MLWKVKGIIYVKSLAQYLKFSKHSKKIFIVIFIYLLLISWLYNCVWYLLIIPTHKNRFQQFGTLEKREKSLSRVRLFTTPWTAGSSVHGIFQARVLEWGAIAFSRGSSRPRDRTRVSHIVDRHFTVCATREAHREATRVKTNN